MKDLVIIGAGASGLVAGIAASKNNISDITIIEYQKKSGKKLSATGNGHCNLGNKSIHHNDYMSHDHIDVFQYLNHDSYNDVIDFYHSIGVSTTYVNDLLYPTSMQAKTVVNALTDTFLSTSGNQILYDHKAVDIIKKDGCYTVFIESNENKSKKLSIKCKNVIISSGSISSILDSSKDACNDILVTLGKLGHTIYPFMPSLAPIKIKKFSLKNASGTRIEALLSSKDASISERGELQIADYGISGIMVFRFVHKMYAGKQTIKGNEIILSLLPDKSEEELLAFIKHCIYDLPHLTFAQILEGFLPTKLVGPIMKLYGASPDINTKKIDAQKLVYLIKHIKLTIDDIYGFDRSQASVGGVKITEINEETFESKMNKGLYITGEIVDLTGNCGGYNLMWATTSGYKAGSSISKQ